MGVWGEGALKKEGFNKFHASGGLLEGGLIEDLRYI